MRTATLPYVLDIDPETIDELMELSEADAEVVFEFLEQLQDGPPFPGPPHNTVHGAYYAQMPNRLFLAWDFPGGEEPVSSLLPGEESRRKPVKRMFPLRILGFGKTVKTYERGKRMFDPY